MYPREAPTAHSIVVSKLRRLKTEGDSKSRSIEICWQEIIPRKELLVTGTQIRPDATIDLLPAHDVYSTLYISTSYIGVIFTPTAVASIEMSFLVIVVIFV